MQSSYEKPTWPLARATSRPSEMFVRLVYESFRRQRRRKLLAGIAIALGVSVATAMIAVANDIGDKISRELRAYGANILVTPQDDTLDVEVGGVNLKPPSDGTYLNEADLPKIKGMFWRNNVVAFAPELPVNVRIRGDEVTLLGTYFAKPFTYSKQEYVTGAMKTFPWWKVNGAWPSDDSQDVLAGERLAARMNLQAGAQIPISGKLHHVAGILSTGGPEDDQIVAPLALAQQLLDRPASVRRVYVSAITKPEDDFAKRDPRTLRGAVYDRWYCSPYPQSIAYQLEEAITHAHAEPIRQVSQNEGVALNRITGLMLLVSVAALIASALAVAAGMATTILERRAEIGLMKALGARTSLVAWLFLAEAVLLAVLAGTVGFAAGSVLARHIGLAIFGSQISAQPVLLPLVLLIAIAVTFAGSALAIRRAVSLDPVYVLRGEG
jgi:putative ABC transport system permease protein